MEVALFPNPRRPGIGLRPKIEAQRPLLPQHARLCPVLEAGSSLGALVYPSLHKNEQIQIGYEGEGIYQFVYAVNVSGSNLNRLARGDATRPGLSPSPPSCLPLAWADARSAHALFPGLLD